MLAPGVLKVLIVGADSLDKLVTVGEQQPYYILECGNQRSRSKPCLDNGCNPTWSTAHKFNLTEEIAVVAVIKDEVTKGIIGQGLIELNRARQYGKDEGAAVLMNLGGNTAGTLRYKLKFSATGASSGGAHRVSEAGSHASASYEQARTPPPATAAAAAAAAAAGAPPAAASDDDAMLAAVTSKVSLAKQAMQQLTAELAELTGADAADAGRDHSGPFAVAERQPPMHASSMQERHRPGVGSAAAAAVAHQRSFQGTVSSPSAVSRQVSSASLSPSASPVLLSPNASIASRGAHAAAAGGELAGWHTSWRGSNSGSTNNNNRVSTADMSVDELLSMYGKGGEQQRELSPGLSSHKQLVLQLQEALAAAHAEKVATEDELGGVKQAMAMMSKQHYLDMKRLRDAAGPAAAGPWAAPAPQESGASIMAMVDTHPPRRQPRVSLDSNSSSMQHEQHSVSAAAAAAAGSRAVKVHEAAGEAVAEDGSPVPAYKLQIQIHQLERQLAEQAANTQQEVAKREAQAAQMAALQSQLDAQVAATRQAQANAAAAEAKAAEQATLAAAARSQVAASQEAQLASVLSSVQAELSCALAEKAELEEALGLMEKNNLAQVAALQSELIQAQEDAAALREGNSNVASLQAQLAAAREEARSNNSEEVEYLQAQLRRTLRQVVELQHQVQVLQSTRHEATNDGDEVQDPEELAIRTEHESLMQELVATKLELAELKEQQVRMQRQLFKAQESLRRDA